MPAKKSSAGLKPRVVYHKDGSRMRSGHLDRDVQCGKWITCDKQGAVYKVTQIKPKVAK